MSVFLALDTSTEACSAALLFQNTIYSDFTLSQRDHAKQILPMIDRLLQNAQCHKHQIDAIFFGQGPGNFTGIRIGVAIAQGLAFGLQKPLVPVSTLILLAEHAYRLHQKTRILSAIDARMGEVYFAALTRAESGHWHYLLEACVIKPESLLAQNQFKRDFSDFYCVGTGFETYPALNFNQQPIEITLPRSEDLLRVGALLFKENQTVRADQAQPLYVRNEVTWKKLEGR